MLLHWYIRHSQINWNLNQIKYYLSHALNKTGASSDIAWYSDPRWQGAWPQWCIGLSAPPSVALCGQGRCIWHTRRWCSQSRCSQCCSYRAFWGAEGPCWICWTSWQVRGAAMRSSWLCGCVWTMLSPRELQGTCSSRPAPQQPRWCGWRHALSSFSYSPRLAPCSYWRWGRTGGLLKEKLTGLWEPEFLLVGRWSNTYVMQ